MRIAEESLDASDEKYQGTPQGGVISPLLANLYLHWFDRAVYGENGPVKWAKVELVRYADDFVLLCRKITPKLESFVTEKIEQWLGLKINAVVVPGKIF